MTKEEGNQKKKTDQIHLKLVHIEIMKTIYKLSFRVIVDGADGKAKAGSSFSVLYGKEEIHSGTSDANGMASFGYRLKYSPTLESIDLICKINDSTAKCFETFQLPAPSEIKFTSSSVKRNDEGGFTASFTANVIDKKKNPRPNCKVVFKGNEQEQSGYTDVNGFVSFKDKTITRKQINDKLNYSVQSAHLVDSENLQLPVPGEIKFTNSSIKQNDKGGFTISFTVNVIDKQKSPRPNCKVVFKGNGQEQSGYSDTNGNVSFQDETITQAQINDKLNYTVQAAHLTDKAEVTVPLWKHSQSQWSQKLNKFPNWKHNRREIIASTIKALVIFTTILLLNFFAGLSGNLIASFILGIFVYRRSIKEDGTGSFGMAVIITLIALTMLSSLPFVAVMIIISLPLYVWEELSRPIDLETNKAEAHPLNPYPKWPIIFGCFMAFLCFFDIWPFSSSSNIDLIAQLNQRGSINVIDVLNHQSSGLYDLKQFIADIWKSAQKTSSWLTFCLVLWVYAMPKELLDFFKNSSGSTGAIGIGSIFYTLKENLLEPLLGWLMTRKRRK